MEADTAEGITSDAGSRLNSIPANTFANRKSGFNRSFPPEMRATNIGLVEGKGIDPLAAVETREPAFEAINFANDLGADRCAANPEQDVIA